MIYQASQSVNISQILSSSFHSTVQFTRSTLQSLYSNRKNPDVFQKVCQVAVTIIEGMNWYSQKTFVEPFRQALDVANSIDCFGFLKLPYTLLYTIHSESIDEFRLLRSVHSILVQQLGINQEENSDVLQERLKALLTEFLEELEDNDKAYRTVASFYVDLEKFLKLRLRNNYKSEAINLKGLKISYKHVPLLERLSNYSSRFVDVACVPYYLREWQLWDLANTANGVGRIKGLGWITDQKIDQWVGVGLCSTYLFMFLDAAKKLYQGRLTTRDKCIAQWNLCLGAAEFAFNLSTLKQMDSRLIVLFTFFAKSIGLFSILYEPNRVFFEVPCGRRTVGKPIQATGC